MKLGELVHIFATDKCNNDCIFCFREFFSDGKSENLEEIAKILAKNKVKKVVIGGGEPVLVKNLDNVLGILKKSDINTELHTNGATLDYERLEQLRGLVDVFGIPIDTLDSRLQSELGRGRNHIKTIKRISDEARKLGFKIGYHTVATYLNVDKLPELYSGFIRNTDFEYWNVYEFNFNLARQGVFTDVYSQKEKVRRLRALNELRGPLNFGKGLSDGLLAKFLLLEEMLTKKFSDSRTEFVDVLSSRAPYFFVNASGDVEFYAWFSQKRTKLGNLLEDGFAKTVKNLRRADRQGPMFNQDDFIEATNDLPIFARLYEGNYFTEEIEQIKPEYHRNVKHLANLWETKKYGIAKTMCF